MKLRVKTEIVLNAKEAEQMYTLAKAAHTRTYPGRTDDQVDSDEHMLGQYEAKLLTVAAINKLL